jgi:Family of unknown function (DUF6152)
MRLCALMLTGCALGLIANAHHSVDATFDLTHEVSVSGTIASVWIRNPHSFLVIRTPDENGNTQRWVLEWRSAQSLGKEGIRSGVLRVGDQITVSINPSRKPAAMHGLVKTVHLDSSAPPKTLRQRPPN